MNMFEVFKKVRMALALFFGLANRVARVEMALTASDALDFNKDDIAEEGRQILEAARSIDEDTVAAVDADTRLENLNLNPGQVTSEEAEREAAD